MRSDAELLRVLFEASEARNTDLLDCGGPAPGCSLYGFMFDLQLAPTAPAPAAALTGLQVFASHADCDYAVFVAEGTWRKKDDSHLPGSKHSCADALKWQFVGTVAGGAAEDGTGGLLEAGCPIRPHALWLLLQEPILLRKDSTTAVYIHSQTSWGAICYRSSPRTNPPPPCPCPNVASRVLRQHRLTSWRRCSHAKTCVCATGCWTTQAAKSRQASRPPLTATCACSREPSRRFDTKHWASIFPL